MLSFRGSILFIVLILLCPVAVMGQNVRLADSLASIGMDYYQRGNNEEAEFYLSQALNIYRSHPIQDTTHYLDVSVNYSYVLKNRAKYGQAISQLKVIRPLVEQKRDTTKLVELHNQWGRILKNQNQYEAALRRYENALDLAEKHKDSLWVAIVHDNMGGAARDTGNFEESLEHRQQALELFEKVGTDMNLAVCLNNIGLTYIQLSMYDRAYDYLSRSLSLSRNLDNTVHLATTYGNMGMVHHNLGNYDQAMIAYQKALDYARKSGNPVKESHVLVNLGNLYNQLGDEQKSLNYYKESLNTVLDHGITSPSELSTKYKNIASRQKDLGELEEARKNYKKALALRKKVGNRYDLALSYLDMAKLERMSQRYEAAISYAMRSKAIADSLGILDLTMESNISLGVTQRYMSDNHKAIRYFRTALRQSRSLPSRESLHPLSLLAYSFDDIESDSAVVYGRQLVQMIETRRSKVGELASIKSGYFQSYSEFYVDLASWLIKYHNNVKDALKMVEASKARSLLDELAQASQNLDEQLPLETRLKKQDLTERIETVQSKLDTGSSETSVQRLQKTLRQTELEYAAFMNELHTQNPGYKKLKYPSPISAEEAQQLVPSNTAVLQYAFAQDDLLIFLITNNRIRVERVNVVEGSSNSEHITRLVQHFRDNILAHAPKQSLAADSEKLVEHLITPFADELSRYSNLIIVPDDVLAYLPFEALTLGDQYLVEQFSIKYAPSLTTFNHLKNNKARTQYSRQMLAVAGSNFGGTTSPLDRGKAYAPLPATLAEVDSIAANFSDATVMKEGNFSESYIKEALRQDYRFIHLATHGIIDEEYPNLSGLALSSTPVEPDSKEDGMLRSSEIYELDINSEMVVLSACNTGLGKIVKGEGMLGLQRSFFYAGVPTVSVSLWNVYDRSTAYFMNKFYKYFLDTMNNQESGWSMQSVLRWVGWDQSVPFGDAAPAMRQAKLRMLEHPLFNHPVYWAPFIVVGR